jgi:hypothetical protein
LVGQVWSDVLDAEALAGASLFSNGQSAIAPELIHLLCQVGINSGADTTVVMAVKKH